ncbi:extracellular solute-binding protein [Piscinibacter sakaiensis]|uniref:Ferric iron ABC transporter, iron-binding protein n=1 Tax=Piscinibacter sakaiensis TaxID=1547922 RepID=A0A0K8NW45_PISS1|nr:extracellular solute-binding protein [Piscinibacter sakaiensis]GAP34598.1 ferric iron ABC transporter, iron-binding protein [Piscinibacter sakaiensis]
MPLPFLLNSPGPRAPEPAAAALRRRWLPGLAAALLAGLGALPALAQDAVLNLYSARHYQTDEALYANFTKATGIRINRVDSDDAGILARLQSEGSASPADVILLVDAARLWRAETAGLFQPVKSAALESRVPANLRGADGGQGSAWFGMSTRARVIVYNKLNVDKADVATYESLALPKNKGKVCTRSGSHPYNLSLFGSLMEHLGEPAMEAWLKGVVANMARDPKGGDTDQIKAVASGECQVALTNSYYLARMMRSTRADDRAAVEKIGVVFPNQQSFGTHLNIAGAAVARHAKNREAAVRFLEYLASDQAQIYFADGNNEWPAVPSVKVSNPALEALGPFKSETIPVRVAGQNMTKVQQMLDRVGFK